MCATTFVKRSSVYPRALFKHAGDAAFLDRLPAIIPSGGQHGTIMHLGRQRPQASTIDIAQWFEVACRSSSASSSSYFGQNASPKDSIISIASLRFVITNSKHHQHHLLFISGWQMVRNVSFHSMTSLVVAQLHTSSDDTHDARRALRKPKKRLC